MNVTYTEPSREEEEAINKEINEVFAKYNCDIQVKSTIQILKRVEDDGHPADTGKEDTETTSG